MKPKLIKSAKRTAPLRAFHALKDRVYDKILERDRTPGIDILPRPWMPPWEVPATSNVVQFARRNAMTPTGPRLTGFPW